MEPVIIWIIVTCVLFIILICMFIFLIVISRKTHALIEFKSGVKGNPIGMFFHDNKYCEWKNTNPDAGMIEDKQHGTFVIESTYIDKKTKNVLIPLNPMFGMSINAKAAKIADDLTYVLREKQDRKAMKLAVLKGQVSEGESLKTLRTSINFSTLKFFVSPILPHNIQSKVVNTVQIRTQQKGGMQIQNIVLLAISALGAIILGGIVLRYVIGG